MNQWYFVIGILFVLFLLIVGMMICAILLIKHKIKKQSNKGVLVSMSCNIILVLAIILYSSSHATYYRYNDWAILQSNINMIQQKYGEFDLGEVRENEKGRVAYYIYTDNGPIMPDHLEHYYYIEYDENGVIYNVYDAVAPGG